MFPQKNACTVSDASVSRETMETILLSFPLFLFSLLPRIAAHGGDVAAQFPDDVGEAGQFVFHTD